MRNQQGQVGIILLLITVVMLTVGISVVSRTSSDVFISETNEGANRALDAAESAVETAFSNSDALNPDTPGVPRTTVSVDPLNLDVTYDVAKLDYLETVVEEGHTIGIDLSSAIIPVGGSLKIEWAKESSCGNEIAPASIAVAVISQTGGPATAAVRRSYVSPCDRGASVLDGYTVVPKQSTSPYYTYTSIPLQSGDQMVRIRPVYGQTAVRITTLGGWALPTQLFKVNAIAQNKTGQETKAVEVDRGLPMPPSIFDYVLYSGTSITP